MTDQHENAVPGTPGQAPVRPDTLRDMLFQAKEEAQAANVKLAASERERADLANKLASHHDTIQMLSALRDLALERGEGVLLYVRRPDEAQPYPIVLGKDELQAVDPNRWFEQIIDPRARAVLDAVDRARGWIPADPAADQRMREDYAASQVALGVEDGLLCERADQLVSERDALLPELHSARVKAGQREAAVVKLEERVGELQAELEELRQPGDQVLEDDLLALVLDKHGAPPKKKEPAPEGEAVAETAGPDRAAAAPEAGEEVPTEDKEERIANRRRARKAKA